MSLMVLACAFVSQAQTVDEILDKYFENTGVVVRLNGRLFKV
jgi:hypothetical protein